jgi:hypothetical protein
VPLTCVGAHRWGFSQSNDFAEERAVVEASHRREVDRLKAQVRERDGRIDDLTSTVQVIPAAFHDNVNTECPFR